MKMELPEAFVQKVVLTFGEKGQAWLRELPSTTEKFLAKWSLTPNGNFSSQMSFNFVLPVVDANHVDAVLKIGPHLKGRAKESNALRLYQGHGAVRLLNFHEADGVSLIELAVPGNELKDFDLQTRNVEATEIAASLIQQLHSQQFQTQPTGFTHISIWGLGFEKFLRENCRGVNIPSDLVLKADSIYKDLVQTSVQETLIHGDLHHSNILKATRQPWLAIDPKGVWGDPAFEVGAFLRNPGSELSAAPNLEKLLLERLQIFQRRLGFDLRRIWGWSFSQCVLAAIWSVEDGQQEWQAWMKIAAALENLETQLAE
jgi:streptomycin 6-kinase